MSSNLPVFAVDKDKLSKLSVNFLNSQEGVQAIQSGQLKGEERLYVSMLNTPLLNATMFLAHKVLIRAGEQFEQGFFIVNGEVEITDQNRTFTVGPGAVLGLSEGMVGLPSRYTAVASTSIQLKIIDFHTVDSIINVLPAEVRAILATIIKRNLTP
jgi:CRP-like cAMP-binding protein